MRKFIINTDGGSRGNPGKAAAAFVLHDENGQIIAREGGYIGVATNNDAEYAAVKEAFKYLSTNFSQDIPLEIELRADSQLVVNQLAGKFKIKNPRLKIVVDEIKNVEMKLGHVVYTYIPREQNKEADALVNEILDQNI